MASERNFGKQFQNADSERNLKHPFQSTKRLPCQKSQNATSMPGCCTKFREPHGTKTVETHLICTSGFGTQSGRNRNAVGTQQSLILAQIPGRSPNTFDLTCSKYVPHLTVLRSSLKRHPAAATNSRFHPFPERYFETQPDCESDVQIL
jgi:hypothetical protein